VPVLFTGTPCQISGLNNYLLADNIPIDKLITCDIICHGVPSPVVWKDYLSYIENKYNDRIQEINFREKELGWHRPRLQIIMYNNMQLLDEKKDIFYQLFYSNCILRPSCHSCQYTSINRVSDITMADCWGIENSHPEMDDNKGLSLLLINSEKGMQIIRDTNVEVSVIDLKDVRQPHLYYSAKVSRKREAFWRDFQKMTFIKVVKKYCNITMKNKMINYFKGLLVKVLNR
jgi:coenzyme F420-reducing hydrogenase beta subunit